MKKLITWKKIVSCIAIAAVFAGGVTNSLPENVQKVFDSVAVSSADATVAGATAYARAHYNDGKGLCAEFCYDVLKAGGYTIPNITYAGYSSRTVAAAQYNYFAHTLGLTSYYLGESTITNNASKIEEGDLVYWDTKGCLPKTTANKVTPKWHNGGSGHIVYVSVANGASSKYCAHNNARKDGGFSGTGASGMWLIKTSTLLKPPPSPQDWNWVYYPKEKNMVITADSVTVRKYPEGNSKGADTGKKINKGTMVRVFAETSKAVGGNVWVAGRDDFGVGFGITVAKDYLKDITIPVSANIPDGIYGIQHKGSGKYVSAGLSKEDGFASCIWGTGAGSFLNEDQKFYLTRQSDNTYSIRSLYSGKVLDVKNSALTSGGAVHQWAWGGGENQKWAVVDCGDGYYKFISKRSGMAMDVTGNGSANGTKIEQYPDNGSNAQKFKLIAAPPVPTVNAISGAADPAKQLNFTFAGNLNTSGYTLRINAFCDTCSEFLCKYEQVSTPHLSSYWMLRHVEHTIGVRFYLANSVGLESEGNRIEFKVGKASETASTTATTAATTAPVTTTTLLTTTAPPTTTVPTTATTPPATTSAATTTAATTLTTTTAQTAATTPTATTPATTTATTQPTATEPTDTETEPQEKNSAKYEIDSVNASVGDTVEISVRLANNPGIISLRNTVSYDADALELIAVEDCGLLRGFSTPSADMNSPFTLRWADSLADSDNTAQGEIVKLTFRIKDNTAAASYEISVTTVEARNVNGQKVEIAEGAGIITVGDTGGFLKGDVSGDGEVDDWDSILLGRYLAGWAVEIDLRAADIDGDGAADDWDYIILVRYLSGWNVTF